MPPGVVISSHLVLGNPSRTQAGVLWSLPPGSPESLLVALPTHVAQTCLHIFHQAGLQGVVGSCLVHSSGCHDQAARTGGLETLLPLSGSWLGDGGPASSPSTVTSWSPAWWERAVSTAASLIVLVCQGGVLGWQGLSRQVLVVRGLGSEAPAPIPHAVWSLAWAPPASGTTPMPGPWCLP